MKAVYLALGLMVANHACAETIISITAQLVIYKKCGISRSSPSAYRVTCEKKTGSCPNISQSKLSRDSKTGWQEQLVTIEW